MDAGTPHLVIARRFQEHGTTPASSSFRVQCELARQLTTNRTGCGWHFSMKGNYHMRSWISSLLALALTTAAVEAHQIWIIPTPKGDAAVVVFNDSPEPDTTCEKVTTIAKAKLFLRRANGDVENLKWTLDKDVYRLDLPGEDARTVAATWEGDGFLFATTYLPDKEGKWQAPAKNKAWDQIVLEIAPRPDLGADKFQVLFEGRPLAGVQTLSRTPGMVTGKLLPKTDKDGVFTFEIPQTGIHSLSVRHKVTAGGPNYSSTLVIQEKAKQAK